MILMYSEWEALFSAVEQAFDDLGVNADTECEVLPQYDHTIVFIGNSDNYEITISVKRKDQPENENR